MARTHVGSGGKWIDIRDIEKVESIKLPDAFQLTVPVCLPLPVKTRLIFRLKCYVYHQIFHILLDLFSTFSEQFVYLCYDTGFQN